eukprot:scaffold4363_cov37-Attheya_sp.AAC.4
MDEVDSFADLDLNEEDIEDVTPTYVVVVFAARRGGGSRTRFCCRPAHMCTIQSHQNQKVAIQDGTIYLQGPRVGQARLEPSLNINQLPVESDSA